MKDNDRVDGGGIRSHTVAVRFRYAVDNDWRNGGALSVRKGTLLERDKVPFEGNHWGLASFIMRSNTLFGTLLELFGWWQ